jgi:predicted acyltransferase
VRGWDKPFFPFKAMGMNALSMYLLSSLLSKVIDVYTGWRPSLYSCCSACTRRSSGLSVNSW